MHTPATNAPVPRWTLRRVVALACAASGLLALATAQAQTSCSAKPGSDGAAVQFRIPQDSPAALATLTGQSANPAPAAALSQLVQQAVAASPAVQSAQRNTSAAEYDLDEQKGNARPQVSLNGSLANASSRLNGVTQPSAQVGSVALGVSAPIYDGGRLSSLEAWRSSLRDATRASESGSRENLALEVVMQTLERERYELQARIYQRYEQQMSCLLDSLQRIVKEDRGRASELIQARKSQVQAQITLNDVRARIRQIEVQLTRLLGPDALALHGMSGALVDAPVFSSVDEFVERSLLLKQMRAEAESQKKLAESLRLAYRPSLSWSVIGSTGRAPDGTGTGNTASTTAVQAGLTFNATLYSGGSTDAGYKAALARADAAQFRLDEVRREQVARVGELRDQIDMAWERARQYAGVLRDTNEVRRNTQDLWFLLGRRSLFDVMAAEGDHYAAQVAFINAVFDGLGGQAQLRSVAGELAGWLADRAKGG